MPLRLSSVLDKFYCPDSQTSGIDPVVEFCNWAANRPITGEYSAEMLTAFASGKKAFGPQLICAQFPQGYTFSYKGTEIFSDLFIPHCVVDSDNIAHFTFPGFGYDYVSSKQLALDWRYLLMAWPIRLNIPTVSSIMFKVVYPSGHIVDASVEPDTWDAVGDAVLSISQVENPRAIPGSICTRCQKNMGCPACQRFLENGITGMESPEVLKNKAYRLIIERVALKTKLEILQQREKDIQASLKKTINTGKTFVIDGVLKVEPEIRTTTTYPNPKALYDVLQRAGLWKWEYVKVLISDLNTDLTNFPKEIKRQVLALRKDVHRDASILEALNGDEHKISSSIFRGISL